MARIRLMNKIDWPKFITDLTDRGVTLREIAEECGFASPGALHDLKSGSSTTCSYERGCALMLMHRRVMRRKATAH